VDADRDHLARSLELALSARAHGNHPFGALLVGVDGGVLLEAENTTVSDRDCTAHAELNLVRAASAAYDPGTLRDCTLYTSTEPCAMCAGAIFWSGIGRVVFALGSATLMTIVGDESGDFTLGLSCRDVFDRGGRAVAVSGPLLEDEGAAVHAGFWRPPAGQPNVNE